MVRYNKALPLVSTSGWLSNNGVPWLKTQRNWSYDSEYDVLPVPQSSFFSL